MLLSKIATIIVTCIVFFLLILYFFHPITNLVGDLGFYLKIGEVIATTKSIPTVNLFSYTYPLFPFINPNWLSELVLYLLAKYLGLNALIILSILTATISFALVFNTAVKKTNYFTSLVVSLLLLQVLYERTDVKPEMFSLLFLSIFITILYKYKDRYTKWIFTLIPIEMIWVNLHIFYFLGITVLILFLLDESLKKEFKSKKFLTLVVVTICASIVTIINPNYITGALYPLFVLHNYAVPVEENSNYFSALILYKDPTLLYFGISIATLWLSIILTIKKLKPIDILLAAFFTGMGVFAVRDFSFFAIGVFIPFCSALSQIMQRLRNKGEKLDKRKILFFEITFFILFCFLLTPTIISNVRIHGFGFGSIDNAKDAVNFLKENNIRGPIFNSYSLGSYLEYQLYPNDKVFVDARPEAYPGKFFLNVYYPMQSSIVQFDKEDNYYKFNVIFFDHVNVTSLEENFLYQLTRSPKWKMVYLNSLVVVFIRDTASNQKVVNKFSMSQKYIRINTNDLSNKDKVRDFANFFNYIGWENQQLAMTIRYLQFDPKNCNALESAAYLLQKVNDPRTALYVNKYNQTCSQ